MRKANIQKLLLKYQPTLTSGRILSLDPSSGGGQSQPGWAFYSSGKLVTSGIIQVRGIRELHSRLRAISQSIEQLCTLYDPHIVVLEEIRRIKRVFSGASVDALFKGIGAILAGISVQAELIEIPPSMWKRSESLDADYEKSDEADAIYLGKFAIEEAGRMLEARRTRMSAPRKAPSTKKVNLQKVKGTRSGPKSKKHSRVLPKKSKAKTSARRGTKRDRKKLG